MFAQRFLAIKKAQKQQEERKRKDENKKEK